MIRRDPGQTTLFAGDTEIVVNTAVTPNVLLGGVRTYTHGGTGTPVAVRSSLAGGGLKYLFNDPQGTATLAMDATTQQVARQQYTPYGQPRASANTTAWPDPSHSYLGKPQDTSTGYTDVGARKYDPTLGRFLSADPVFDATSPQQLGGYTYAGDNPVGGSDPSGLESCFPVYCSGKHGTYGNLPPIAPTTSSDDTSTTGGTVADSSQGSTLIRSAANKSALPAAFAPMLYQKLMWYINEYREKAAANSPNGVANRDFTLVVAQVDVDEPQGMEKTTPRFVVFSSAGLKSDLESELDDLGVAVVKAPKPPKGQPSIHAEEVAAAYAEDEDFQKEDLGGKIVKVQNAYVTTQVCGSACARALGRFVGLGESESEELKGSNGMLFGKIVNKAYLNEARKAIGLSPGRGAAMRVVTDAIGSVVLPEQLIAEAEEEGGNSEFDPRVPVSREECRSVVRVLEMLSIDTGYAHAVHPMIQSGMGAETLLVSTWGNGPEIHRWDLKNGVSVWDSAEELPGCNGAVLVSLPDGRRTLAVSTEEGVERWNALTGEPLEGLYSAESTVWGLAAGTLPDGRTVLVGAGNDGTVHRWDVASGEPFGPPLRGHGTTVLSVGLVHLSVSKAVIVSGDDSGFLRRWDAVTAEPIGAPIAAHASQVNVITPLVTGGTRKLFASSDADGEICRWDAITGEQVGGPLTAGADVYTLATACPGGMSLLLAAGAGGGVVAWNAITDEVVNVSLPGVSVAALDQPDGSALVVTGTSQGNITVWSLSE
ncbi:RHS repeat-associated core domain-containing protein [Streptomyces sp. NPDC091280]|uniref:RHS repeat-associated core domain-containing protein n=1 Tax=Streptomyces sp. NPDC091280 TaxID=3365984 RepID=UPI0037F2DCF0